MLSNFCYLFEMIYLKCTCTLVYMNIFVLSNNIMYMAIKCQFSVISVYLINIC